MTISIKKQDSAHLLKFLNNAITLHNQGKLEKAHKIYNNVVKQWPDSFDANYLLGTLHLQKGEHQLAINYLQIAIRLDPASSVAFNNLGIGLKNTGDISGALSHFEHAIQLDQCNSDAYVNLGSVLQEQGDINQSIELFKKALAINSNVIAHLNLANAYRDIQRFDKAEIEYLKVLSIEPTHIEAKTGLAIVYRETGMLDKSYQTLKEALELPGNHTQIHWLTGLHHLYTGDYVRGWNGYEYGRITSPPAREPVLEPNKEWRGQCLDSKSIIVYGEQGIGDVVMFLSCLGDLISKSEKTYICCDERLYPIINNSFNNITTVSASNKNELIENIHTNNIDYCTAIGELPRHFRKSKSDFPIVQQYLYSNVDSINKWQQRYNRLGDRANIGISWKGGKSCYDRYNRSTDLAQWTNLLHGLDANYINLQYGDSQEDIAQFSKSSNINVYDWDDSDPLIDLNDFFAQIAALDLVITVDNSTAHIAGSLGIPTLMLLPTISDWRWLHTGDDSPWYQSLTLIRKLPREKWDSCISNTLQIAGNILNYNDSKSAMTNTRLVQNALPETTQRNNEDRISIDILFNSDTNNNSNTTNPSCAIITPIGPGHNDIFSQCQQSIIKACMVTPGIFNQIVHIHIDDSDGRIGRSLARNNAIEYALDNNIGWLFFLDADDLMAPNAFEIASILSSDFDAIWGKICSFDHYTNEVDERASQIGETQLIHDIVINDPYNTIQMGHFVKTTVAANNLFNINMDCGEDFDYYLRVWQQYKCIRTEALLFINRRGLHSSGPKSADGNQWRKSVEHQLSNYCINHKMITEFMHAHKNIRFRVTNPFDIIQRHLMHGNFFEVEELEYIKKNIKKNAMILEVGANIGNHIIYYSKFIKPRGIIAIEPNPVAINILDQNLELNNVTNIDKSVLGIGAGSNESKCRLATIDNNLGASYLVEDPNGDIRVTRLDNIISSPIDFIKIDVENMEIAVLQGCNMLINKFKPAILIEVMNDNITQFMALISELNYSIKHEFNNINATNFYIEPNG